MQSNNPQTLSSPRTISHANAIDKTERRKTYFDQLPFDALLQICRYACREEVSEQVTDIARTDGSMAAAISECLNGKIDLKDMLKRPLAFYESAVQLCKDVKELCLPRWEIKSPLFHEVLTRNSLKKVEMPMRYSYLQALSQGQSVESLSLISGSFHVSNYEFLAALDKLPLKELEIRCYLWPGACDFGFDADEGQEQDFRYADEECPSPEDIASRCKDIERLHLNCKCRNAGLIDFVPLLETFEKLKHLTVSAIKRRLHPEEVQALRRLESIRITDEVYCGDLVARRIRTNVTSLNCYTFLFPFEIEGIFEECSCLKEVDLKIHRDGLNSVAQYKGKLSSLRLTWKPEGIGRRRSLVSCNKDDLLAITMKHSSLSQLEIYNTRLQLGTIRAILSSLGTSLKIFGCSIELQEESADTRLISLMSTCTQYCSSLQELWIAESEGFPTEYAAISQVTRLPWRCHLCLTDISEERKSEIWNSLSRMNYHLENFKSHLLRMQIDYMIYGSINAHEPYNPVPAIAQ